MNNLKCRKQGFNKIICRKTNKEISFSDCNSCPYKEYKASQKNPIKKRTYSLAKAEKERFSIITNNLDKCVICGKKKANLHEVYYGTGKRQLSIKYGCVIPLCYTCHIMIHNNHTIDLTWKIKMQEAFESVYNDDFIKVFGKNYK